ncbi:MAG: anaerobic ribonucleoside triphosphate reductase [Oscillospiraceae bacterium]|jgi:ribonucleoside-triphosphate reductase|nr:anaerobic ribonucleoside triphosphate reductase [Oscillospiraceae bacterium]
MINTIIKRDGRHVDFSIEKIANAIYMSAQATGGKDYDASLALARQVTDYLEQKGFEMPTVEEIQDAVEKILIENGHARTAKLYILYRADRSKVREMNTRLMKIYEGLTFVDAKENDIKRENANIDADTSMGTMLKYGSEGAKQFNELYVLNPAHSKAHHEGDIHIHDLDFLTLTTTCCQIDIVKLFEGGFSTGHGFLREPNDIASYSALACIAIQSNQNDQHGGQSIPNFDYGMAKGVAKTYRKAYISNLAKALELSCNEDDMLDAIKSICKKIESDYGVSPVLSNDNDYHQFEAQVLKDSFNLPDEDISKAQVFALKKAVKETDRSTYQAMEALIHNLNTMHSRAGAQIPFSSINYGSDVSAEGRLVVKNVLLATEAGLGNGETPVFPIQIFRIKEGISYNKEDPNYDLFKLACRVSAKRLFPNFSFMDSPFNKQYYIQDDYNTHVAYMGCRTRVMTNVYDKSREVVCGRGNLSFTSINLPRLAIKAHGNIDLFFEDLDRKIDLVIEQLLDRFAIQSKKRVRNFPFLMGQGLWLDSDNLSLDDEIGEILKHGTLSVGFIGLAETLKVLLDAHHGESVEARNLGLEIVAHMRSRMDAESEKTGLNFSLLATPAEGLSGRFVKLDRAKYGVIPGVTDRAYYTNSFHVPVYYPISAFEKIKIEGPYHTLTNAGHISYIEMDGNPSDNLEAFESVIRCMKENKMGYGSVNHPVDRDPVCGYTGIIGDVCPRCGRYDGEEIDVEVLRKLKGLSICEAPCCDDNSLESDDKVTHPI